MAPPDLDGWLPISVSHHRDEPAVEWCRFGSRRFTEPFFEDTTRQALREPFNLLFRHQTSLDTLVERQKRHPGLQPDGFIFHMSRCGSTLVSQMLAALPEHIVLAEPPPLDAILRMDRHGATDEQRIAWLQGWMGAMSQPRHGEQRLFVKLDAWHILDLLLLRRAFPDTPWVFLHRNPIEVLVSALRSPGLHFVPNLIAMRTGITPEGAQRMSRTEYSARVLATIMQSAVTHLRDYGGKAFDYTTLPGSVISGIAPHFGLTLSPAQIEAMEAKAPFHAKTPQLFFEPDGNAKQREATEEARAFCAALLDPLYAQL